MKISNKNILKIMSVSVAVLIMCCIFTSCFSATDNTEYDNNDIHENDVTAPAAVPSDYKTPYVMTDNLYDFQIEINGNVYDFPMTVEEFMKCGWTINKYEDAEQMVGAGKYNLICFSSAGESDVHVRVVNFSSSEQKWTDCHVGGMMISKTYIKSDIENIKMAKGITFGVSTLEDIIAAYGDYDRMDDADTQAVVSYELEAYKSVSLTVYKDTGTLGSIEMFTNDQPAEEIPDEVSDELPEEAINYKAPSSAGKTPGDGVVEIDGVLYQFPVPVKELLKNGWEIDREKSDDAVAGRRNGYVYLYKDDKKMDNISILNYTEKNVPVENCMIEGMSASEYNKHFIVPGYIDTASSLEEIKQLVVTFKGEVQESDVKYEAEFRNEDTSTFLYINFDKNDNKITYYSVGYKNY